LGAKGEIQERRIENESTNTKNCGGMVRSSEEVSVMEMEQRDRVRQVLDINQLEKEELMARAELYNRFETDVLRGGAYTIYQK